MLTQEESLIRRADHDRVLGDPFLFQSFQHPADTFIDSLHAGEVIVHVSIVAPPHQILARQFGLSVRIVTRFIIRVPRFQLLFGHVGRRLQLGIQFRERTIQPHVVIADCFASSGVVIKQSLRLGVLAVLVPAEMTNSRSPLTMRSLVLAHQQEWLGFVAVLDPVD